MSKGQTWSTRKKTRQPKTRSRSRTKLAQNAADIELEIERYSSQGDGIGTARYTINHKTVDWPVFVPASIAGEQVCARPTKAGAQGIMAELTELIRSSPDRTDPICDVFPACGGCTLQHMSESAYRKLKEAHFKQILEKTGLNPAIRPPVWTHMTGRRRARLSFRRTAEKLIIGFTGRQSHFIHPLDSCGVLIPELKALIPKLASWAEPCFAPGQTGQIAVNMLTCGADILLFTDQELPTQTLTMLSAKAAELPLVRLALKSPAASEPILMMKTQDAILQQADAIGAQKLYPHPGAFLQASQEGECALAQAILEATGIAPDHKTADRQLKLVELYCGIGTFSLPLLYHGIHLIGYEADKAAVDSLLMAARVAGYGSRCEGFVRDLAAAPVRLEELTDVDVVLLDPPRSGALAQVKELAKIKENNKYAVPRIVMLSCNPYTGMRDVAILTTVGYHLESVQMIDQFVRTTHTEMVACLNWAGVKTGE